MRVGINLPAHYPATGGLDIVRLARLAESLGFDDFWVSDHLTARLPMGDVQVMAAMAGAATERLQICTGVIQAGMRHPLVLAKFLGALSHEIPGRLVAGIGVGGDDHAEWASLGLDATQRGRRFDEILPVLGQLLANQSVDHDGTFYRFAVDPLFASPPPPVPIWIGARLDGAIRRAAHVDGWFGMLSAPNEFAAARAKLVETAASAGRPAPKTGIGFVASVVGSDADATERCASYFRRIYGLPPDRGFRRAVGGLGRLRDLVEEYRSAGADRICITIVDPPDVAWGGRGACVRPRINE